MKPPEPCNRKSPAVQPPPHRQRRRRRHVALRVQHGDGWPRVEGFVIKVMGKLMRPVDSAKTTGVVEVYTAPTKLDPV